MSRCAEPIDAWVLAHLRLSKLVLETGILDTKILYDAVMLFMFRNRCSDPHISRFFSRGIQCVSSLTSLENECCFYHYTAEVVGSYSSLVMFWR